ncbi:MAG: Ig-like domain-containing protein, partial [Oscillospiraceae bacterium]|nr:Ig-like domain-containing protein [Oscillospiraceae bacterium]
MDETGTVMGIASGRATITAAAGDLKAEKEITVLVPLEGVSVPETLELALNKTESAKLEVKPVPANAAVTGSATYASSDEAVAAVSADGTVTAKANGEAVITVTLE